MSYQETYESALQKLERLEDTIIKGPTNLIKGSTDLDKEIKETFFNVAVKSIEPLFIYEYLLEGGVSILNEVYKFINDEREYYVDREYSGIFKDIKTILEIGCCFNKGDKEGIKKYVKSLNLPEDLETKVYEKLL